MLMLMLHVNTSPALAVATLNSSFPLHVCDIPVPANVLYHVRKVSPPIPPLSANLTTTPTSQAHIKKFPHFHQQLTRKIISSLTLKHYVNTINIFTL